MSLFDFYNRKLSRKNLLKKFSQYFSINSYQSDDLYDAREKKFGASLGSEADAETIKTWLQCKMNLEDFLLSKAKVLQFDLMCFKNFKGKFSFFNKILNLSEKFKTS